jgi:hypothetical protein
LAVIDGKGVLSKQHRSYLPGRYTRYSIADTLDAARQIRAMQPGRYERWS